MTEDEYRELETKAMLDALRRQDVRAVRAIAVASLLPSYDVTDLVDFTERPDGSMEIGPKD